MIYSDVTVDRLLGCMLNDSDLANSDKYKLDKDDFSERLVHRMLYGVLHNLNEHGCKKPTFLDIENVLIPYKAKYNEFVDDLGGNPSGYIETISKIADVDNFEYYYNTVRKLSLIRESHKNGDNISKFWDIDKSDEENLKNIEDYTIEDILSDFELSVLEKKRKYGKEDEDTNRKKAGYKGIEIFHSFKEKSFVDAQFESKYLTTLWGGFNKKQLYIRSGDTSSGKSRSIVGDLASVSIREVYDSFQNKWIENKNGGHKCLYIGCEMELNEECDPLFWAYTADVESSLIIKGKTNKEQDKIVEKAIRVVNDADIFLTDMPSFNIRRIHEEIAYYKKHYNIEYVGFDYMLINNALVKEFVSERGKGVAMRGDEILLELSKSLKDICKKENVGMITATQTNADIKDFRVRDYQVLRGGKAVSDKATGGSISMPITPQELKLVEPYIQKLQERGTFGKNRIEPNFVETVYKSRFSEYPKEAKIFSYYNLGTMRRQELFVTTKDFKPIENIDRYEY